MAPLRRSVWGWYQGGGIWAYRRVDAQVNNFFSSFMYFGTSPTKKGCVDLVSLMHELLCFVVDYASYESLEQGGCVADSWFWKNLSSDAFSLTSRLLYLPTVFAKGYEGVAIRSFFSLQTWGLWLKKKISKNLIRGCSWLCVILQNGQNRLGFTVTFCVRDQWKTVWGGAFFELSAILISCVVFWGRPYSRAGGKSTGSWKFAFWHISRSVFFPIPPFFRWMPGTSEVLAI